jgi:hypothetical protein
MKNELEVFIGGVMLDELLSVGSSTVSSARDLAALFICGGAAIWSNSEFFHFSTPNSITTTAPNGSSKLDSSTPVHNIGSP